MQPTYSSWMGGMRRFAFPSCVRGDAISAPFCVAGVVGVVGEGGILGGAGHAYGGGSRAGPVLPHPARGTDV